MTSILSAAPWVTPGAPLGSRYSWPPATRDRVAAHALQPGFEDGSGGDHAFAEDPRLDDPAILDQRRAGLADPALDQPFRQLGNPPI